MDYRTDARPTCTSCGLAFAATELGLDDSGARCCDRCLGVARTAALDRLAGASESRARFGRRWIAAAMLLVLSVVGAYLTTVAIRRYQLGRANGRILARLTVAAVAFDKEPILGTRPCDDKALNMRGAPTVVPWAVGTPGSESFEWSTGLLTSGLLRSSEIATAEAAAARVEATSFLVVLLPLIEGRDAWSGKLAVVDIGASRALCWTTVEVYSHHPEPSLDAAALREAAGESLRRITSVLSLE